MSSFALKIAKRDGSEYHAFYPPSATTDTAAYAQALQIRDGWRSERPGAYYTFVDGAGQRESIPVADIADVEVVVGADR